MSEIKFITPFAFLFMATVLSATEPVELFVGKSNFELAQKKAQDEGKYLFIDFYAKWCTPCRWMDETTFKDERIVNKLMGEFVSIKVNIDEMEGFELKSRFDIQYLPTILIFNHDGKMVERIEETLSPSNLLEILEKNQAVRAESYASHPLNTSPKQLKNEIKSKPNIELSAEEYDQYINGQNTTVKTKNFQMQLGIYSNIDRANRKAEELQKQLSSSPIVVEDLVGGNKLYRVLMGSFTSLSEAQSFQKSLKEQYNLESIVK